MKERKFPFWSAPFAGALAGAFLAMKAGQSKPDLIVEHGVVGALVGGCAGLLISVIDPRPGKFNAADNEAAASVVAAGTPSGVVGRFLAVIGVVLSWIPFLGSILNLIGLWVNWRTDDWARPTSKVAFFISLLFSVLGAMALVMAAFG